MIHPGHHSVPFLPNGLEQGIFRALALTASHSQAFSCLGLGKSATLEARPLSGNQGNEDPPHCDAYWLANTSYAEYESLTGD